MCAPWARGRMNDESGCLFGAWTLPAGGTGEKRTKLPCWMMGKGNYTILQLRDGEAVWGGLRKDGSLRCP